MKPSLPSRIAPNTATPMDPPGLGVAISGADVIATSTLFGGRRELLIEHAGCLYRLRITQNNKLILTK
jgi:hemin uptake protein HemP